MFKALLAFLFFFVSGFAFADGDKDKGKDDNKKPEPRTIVIKREAARKPEDDDDDKKDDNKDDDLNKKLQRQRQDADNKVKETKDIERSVEFNLSVDSFVKDNAEVLPKDVADILKLAHKETYDSPRAKTGAIQSAIIQSYFSIQANVDNLTTSQKKNLEDYNRLTKSAKEERAPEIWVNIFEPAFEFSKKILKAQELSQSRSGYANGTDTENAYKDKLIKGSRRQYLGIKEA
jgi:hypothetical protein